MRERQLADEFISVRLIDFVADAEAMVDETLLVIAAVDVRFRPSLAVVDEHLVRALDAELTYRKAKGYLIADADSPSSLERFVERSGRLKKHFEAVLALDREAYPVDERLHIWFTCLAALIGGACAFALQTYLVRWSSERTVGWGLVGLTVMMGATYAMRDRIKESTLMLLTNALNPDGSVADRFEEITDGIKFKNTVTALRHLVSIVPDDITLVLEPLNTLVDHPGYYLADIDTASAIVREVGSERLKILCDLYHFGVMGADLKRIVTDHLSEIGHFHITDVPGRHEPGTGSVDRAAILRLIQDQGYTGYVGFEYFPKDESDSSLEAIRKFWEANVGR